MTTLLHPNDRPSWRASLPARGWMSSIDGKAVRPPDGGWRHRDFIRSGAAMIRAIVRAQRIVTRKVQPAVMRAGAAVFAAQVEEIIEIVRSGLRTRAPAPSETITLTAHEDLWMQAINEVLGGSRSKLRAELVPPLQSVMAQAVAKVGPMVGGQPNVKPSDLLRETELIASRITRVSPTTRSRFHAVVLESIRDGDHPTATARKLREQMEGYASTRLATIARTESSNAWTRGAVLAYQSTPTLTEVSVIGCESREEDRWDSPSYQQFMYQGESTCNIEGVPVSDAGMLQFHPNHTGSMVPSRFAGE